MSVEEKYSSFDDMDLDVSLLRGIFGYGFERPSAIQALSINVIRQGKDVIAQAQSGTGKTGAFLISSMSMVDKKLNEPQVLIIAPTRELANQIHECAKNFNTYTKFSIGLLIGGNIDNNNNYQYVDNTQIIIGTPGKIVSMLKRNQLKTKHIKLLILDEADDLLNTGFKYQLKDIIQYIPSDSQICIFSATINNDTLELTTRFMRDPVKILLKNEELTLDGIIQYYISLDDERFKYDTLVDLYKYLSIHQTIIYVNKIKKAEILKRRLLDSNFTVSVIHSELTQAERNEVIKLFRLGEIRILLATDIIARGLDVQQVSTVINYDLPINKENYIHRIGRSGRYGRKGIAINFVTKDDFSYLKQIQSFYNTNIEPLPDPTTLHF